MQTGIAPRRSHFHLNLPEAKRREKNAMHQENRIIRIGHNGAGKVSRRWCMFMQLLTLLFSWPNNQSFP